VTGCNAANERIKRRYFDDLKESEGLQPVTIEHSCRAIAEYERFTAWKDFRQFSRKDAIAFRKWLHDSGKGRAGGNIRSSVHSKLLTLQKFYRWLAREPGFKSRIRHADVDCFSLSLRDQRIATRRRKEQRTPSLQQVLMAIDALPSSTDIELRDRAILVGLALTGSRVKALTTLQVKHVRPDRLGIDFYAGEVKTKGGKSFTTIFVPFGDRYRQMLLDYVDRLRALGWADEEPLFPKTEQRVRSSHSFVTSGLAREPWKGPEAVRTVCRRAFAAASLPYYPPQAFRRMVVREGMRRCRTAEAFKAWSQNIAHENPLTSLRNYGEVPFERQAELIRALGSDEKTRGDLDRLRDLLNSPAIQAIINGSGSSN
jgi:site-specific recombinase XerD